MLIKTKKYGTLDFVHRELDVEVTFIFSLINYTKDAI